MVVNKEDQTVTVRGGAKLRSLDEACRLNGGLAVTAGSNPDTGVIGLTLGGGFGFLMRSKVYF